MAKKKAAAPTTRATAPEQITLEVNGKSYVLSYDFDSIIAAEEATGLELLVGVDWRKINARRIRAMLYASMLPKQPAITLAEIGRLITVRNLPAIEAALVEAWMNAKQPEAAEAKPEAAA